MFGHGSARVRQSRLVKSTRRRFNDIDLSPRAVCACFCPNEVGQSRLPQDVACGAAPSAIEPTMTVMLYCNYEQALINPRADSSTRPCPYESGRAGGSHARSIGRTCRDVEEWGLRPLSFQGRCTNWLA